ncbi:MAG: tetratricopeptide repeat protein [Hyphomicrobiaceae bacterium]|nr:MAG: tetratricopeptide repeat protein [Hyphomicrobiaceae bacterium]
MVFVFDEYCLDSDRRELRRGSKLIALEPQVFDLLVYLVQNRNRVVSKDDVLAAVWAGRAVSESTLTSRMNSVRSAIGDTGEQQRLVRTIPRKGFRFVGDVREEGVGAPAGASGRVAARLPDKPSIAVLPFTNMSGDPEQEYFSDGISEEIITALSRLHWFFVIARNSTFVYKGKAHDVKQVGRELGVRYILEGSVRKSGRRVRVTSQLLDANTGSHIWSERYDRELTDIFAVQDEITASVTAAIEPKLLAAEGLRAERRSADDLDAWDLVARALSYFWKFTAADSATAIAILRQAVGQYPNYAPAHSMLACALLVSSYVGWTPPGSERELAATLAHRAVALDDDDPWAHVALGILALTGRQTDEAIRYFGAALDLNPNFATAAGFVGFTLALDGQSEDALRQFERAMRISPRDPFNSFFFAGIAVAHYLSGHFADAVKWARQAVQLRPGYLGGHRILCASLAKAGQIDEARAAMATLRRLMPDMSTASIRQSVPYTARTIDRFLEGLRAAGLSE